MSALTKNERNGLEDIFLSIHVNKTKDQKFRKLAYAFIYKHISIKAYNLLKRAKNKQKKMKFTYFLTHLTKQKKNLILF